MIEFDHLYMLESIEWRNGDRESQKGAKAWVVSEKEY